MTEIKITSSTNPRTGKPEKVVHLKNKKGRWIRLLNPSQRSRKYAKEIKDKKNADTGLKLSSVKLSYRSGYLKARSDNAKAYKANKAKRAKRKKK